MRLFLKCGCARAQEASVSAKKGVRVSYFRNVSSALKAARLSWTYNWWYSLPSVRISRASARDRMHMPSPMLHLRGCLLGCRVSNTRDISTMLVTLCSRGQGVSLPKGVQYVPMIPAAEHATASAISAAKATRSGVLLGYNEPDIANQGNNTVAVMPLSWPQHLWPRPQANGPAQCLCCESLD